MNINLHKQVLDNLEDGVYGVDLNRKIIYWNKNTEVLTGYTGSEVIGKDCGSDILMCITETGIRACDGLCPLSKVSTDIRDAEVYILHKRGHRLAVKVRNIPILDSNNHVEGFICILKDNSERLEVLKRMGALERMSLIDPLTEVANRRFIETTLKSRIDGFNRYGWAFGVIYIDIDHFKKINDTYGHDVGDEVLRMVANSLVGNLRSFDFLGRLGGEEFLAIIVNVDEIQLYSIADRLRVLVEQSSLTIGQDKIRVTISSGAVLIQPGDTIKSLLRRADRLMYQSKILGRDRVSIKMKPF